MARREQFVNNAKTTLNGGIDASVTTVTVTSGSVFPAEGDFRVIVNDEIMLVTARSTNDLTVIRGQDGTSGAIQADASEIRVILTAGGMEKYINDAVPNANNKYPHRLQDDSDNILTDSNFSWDNQGSASVATDASGSLTLTYPVTVAQSVRVLYKSAPTAPYTLTAKILFGPGYSVSTSGSMGGIGFRENASGKLFFLAQEVENLVAAHKFTDPTTFSSTLASINARSQEAWLRIEDDNVDLNFSVSADGINWYEIGSEGRTTFMASAPDEIFWGVNSLSSQDNALFHLQSWTEE